MDTRKQLIGSLALSFFLSWGFPVSSAIAEEGGRLQAPQKIPLSVLVELKPRLDAYLKLRSDQVGSLAVKYGSVLDTRLDKAADAGDLKAVDAFGKEKKRLEVLKKALTVTAVDSVVAVSEGVTLPDLDTGSPEELVSLRKIWTAEREKIRNKIDPLLQQSLKTLESNLTKKRDYENAKAVLSYRESLPGAKTSPAEAVVMKDKTEVITPVTSGTLTDSAIAVATKDKPFENSLKMRFVPVKITGGPTRGRTLLFSIWETRVKDYEAFIRTDRDRVWNKPAYKQRGDHPAVNMSWDDAQAFCAWLTKQEWESGQLDKKEIYRLPTDFEWGCAVGLGELEDPDKPPASKFSTNPGIYPWGEGFPPTKGAGNYYGEETTKNPFGNQPQIKNYDDGFDRTAPVGSFIANPLGLYDMGGNVWEYCQDIWNPAVKDSNRRVWRGGSWRMYEEKKIRSAGRLDQVQSEPFEVCGFRVVIARGRLEK